MGKVMNTVITRTIKVMLIFIVLAVIGSVKIFSFEGVLAAMLSLFPGILAWFVIIFSIFGLYELSKIILKLRKDNMREDGSGGLIANTFKSLRNWYSGVTKKQRNIILLVAIVLSAIPVVGWIFVAPWMLPMVAYLEYHRE